MISMDKSYRTKMGDKVTLWTVLGRDEKFPVVGEVITKNAVHLLKWDKNGKYHNYTGLDDLLDLVEVKIPIVVNTKFRAYVDDAGKIYALSHPESITGALRMIAEFSADVSFIQGEGLEK
jgi:hypothetical protein